MMVMELTLLRKKGFVWSICFLRFQSVSHGQSVTFFNLWLLNKKLAYTENFIRYRIYALVFMTSFTSKVVFVNSKVFCAERI